MGSSKEFFSQEEIAEFRRELEALTMEDADQAEEKEQPSPEAFPEGQILQDIIDETNLTPLKIEENGSYVKISEDDMCAWLYLMPPGAGKENYTMEELTDFLEKMVLRKGITIPILRR